MPTIGAALIIIFSSTDTFSGKLLGSRILVGIGLISYSAYLWHKPLFVFARHKSLREPSQVVFFGLSLLSLILAYASWKYVEYPFRKRAICSRTQIFSFTIIGSVSFIFIGLIGHHLGGFPERYPIELRKIASLTSSQVNADRNRLRDQLCKTRIHNTICGKLSVQSPNILILGDSHGPDGLNIFSEAFPSANFLISEQGGCPALPDLKGIPHDFKNCDLLNKSRFEAIKELRKQINVVILSQRMSIPRIEGTKILINWLHDLGLRVVVLGAGPWYQHDLASMILKNKDLDDLDMKLADLAINRHYKVDDELKPFVTRLGGVYVSEREVFCPEGICKNILSDGNPLVFDKHHLTLSAAILLGATIRRNDPSLLDDLVIPPENRSGYK